MDGWPVASANVSDVATVSNRRSRRHLGDVSTAVIVAAAGSLLVALSGVRGADYPGQYLRAELWNQTGFTVWNNYWYAGHPIINYSLITPALMGFFGPVLLCIVVSIVATAGFTDLLRNSLPAVSARWGGIVFAIATVVNVVVGRVAFAVGLACALLAVWAWQRDWLLPAAMLAFITPLASPVAATFVGIVAAAVFLDALWPRPDVAGAVVTRIRHARPAVLMGVATTVPLLLMTVLVGSDGGTFPFRGGHFLISVGVLAVTWYAVPNRIVRIGVVLTAVASLVLFVVPTPLGGNFVRLAQFIAVPLAVAGAARMATSVTFAVRVIVVAGAFAGTVWTVQHAVVAASVWAGDASTELSFHQPLIDEVLARNADGEPLGRLEIPFTANHWETYYIADQVPYIRGWERQIDLSRNAVLYDPALTSDEYHDWVHRNGVRWIAIPDAPLDRGGQPEADVLNGSGGRTGRVDWLTLVWQNDQWRLYEVADRRPIVDAPATLESQTPDEIVISVVEAATVTVRYRFTSDAVVSGTATLSATTDGWMLVSLPARGSYTISVPQDSIVPVG